MICFVVSQRQGGYCKMCKNATSSTPITFILISRTSPWLLRVCFFFVICAVKLLELKTLKYKYNITLSTTLKHVYEYVIGMLVSDLKIAYVYQNHWIHLKLIETEISWIQFGYVNKLSLIVIILEGVAFCI